MRFYASLISLAVLVVAGCGRQDALDYGFVIRNVLISPAYQSLNIRLQQNLELSQQAREALEHGVTLSIRLEMELRNDNNMIVARRDVRHFYLRYLPLIERYQLSEEETGDLQSFSRLRHLLAVIDELNVQLSTGPLPTGSYELRTRIRLDESRLPTPMQLPAWFSRQWQHDSEWSVWPFEISA
ncbi:MAG: DUF4390 domain-containing protein [Xanthomonadales bacterium]|nr:DUF4390 domain-containing protein [Gammaproteobacteria bacterium]MBT8072910.1 DUF4390 domain-containing protein [Gammaproteobacteria bacterium]MBT8075440.1 DUF4390 domain-containing protein [Gammaproteobacteria bacterium]NNK03751.1 DUF4390 domain-containing protein [Xanthomonadales bacterium]NNK98851.1 DUF4390 domain-containing protein [Xanthomonadales bacterium]